VRRLILHNMASAVSVDKIATGNLAAMSAFFADDGFGNFIEVDVVTVVNFFFSDMDFPQ